MRVDHRRTHVVVAKQLLHGADVVARLQQVRRETVAGRPLGKFGPANRRRDLLSGLIGMVPANDIEMKGSRYSRGRDKKLQAKVRRGVRDFSFDRGRQKHAATATFPHLDAGVNRKRVRRRFLEGSILAGFVLTRP